MFVSLALKQIKRIKRGVSGSMEIMAWHWGLEVPSGGGDRQSLPPPPGGGGAKRPKMTTRTTGTLAMDGNNFGPRWDDETNNE